MSLKQKTERAIRQVLEDAGVLVTLHCVLSQESGETTVQLPCVNIQALDGPQVTPRSRVIKMRTLVAVRTAADPAEDDTDDPEDLHAENVDAVTETLNVSNLNTLLSAAVDGFTCFGVNPKGEADPHKPEGERSLADGWIYELWVCESDST